MIRRFSRLVLAAAAALGNRQIARERTSAYGWRTVLSASQPVAVG